MPDPPATYTRLGITVRPMSPAGPRRRLRHFPRPHPYPDLLPDTSTLVSRAGSRQESTMDRGAVWGCTVEIRGSIRKPRDVEAATRVVAALVGDVANGWAAQCPMRGAEGGVWGRPWVDIGSPALGLRGKLGGPLTCISAGRGRNATGDIRPPHSRMPGGPARYDQGTAGEKPLPQRSGPGVTTGVL
jgi:hypothetical protein